MQRRHLEAGILSLILIAIVALAANPYPRARSNSPGTDVSQKLNDKGYSTDMKELRDKFNRDKGKVRLVLLLSPT
ncbi:MAG: hypothetical protein ACR2HX_16305 [Pyrinomonadaceae bacterium]